jgi:hypothetical protein
MTWMAGFPLWTLWGMGAAAAAAVLALLIAFLAQSPRTMRRLGLDVYRLDLRVREFTGYALAALLLVVGFFLAGVPLGEPVAAGPAPTETPTQQVAATTPDVPATLTRSAMTTTLPIATASVTPRPVGQTPISGAFGAGQPDTPTASPTLTGVTSAITTTAPLTPSIPTLTPTGGATGAPTPTGTPTRVTTSTPTMTTTPTPTATPSATPTTTPSPTATATPSLTPTPIDAPTAVVNSTGSNVWVYRSPGGQQLVLVPGGTPVILLNRRASQGGFLWREVMTVQGQTGWIDQRYLDFGEEPET